MDDQHSAMMGFARDHESAFGLFFPLVWIVVKDTERRKKESILLSF